MRPRMWAMPILVGVIAVSACGDEPLSSTAEESAVQAQAPADGNGNKQVITFNGDVPDPLICPNGAELRLNFSGWVQTRTFQNGNRVQLDVWHTTHT